MLHIRLRLVGLNIYFCDVFLLTKKRVQKGVYRNNGLFLLWDHTKVRQMARFYTTHCIPFFCLPCSFQVVQNCLEILPIISDGIILLMKCFKPFFAFLQFMPLHHQNSKLQEEHQETQCFQLVGMFCYFLQVILGHNYCVVFEILHR